MNSTRSPFLTLALAAMVAFLVVQLKNDRRRWETHLQALGALTNRVGAAAQTLPPAPAETQATDVYKRVSPSVVAVANHALVRRGFFGFQLYEVPQGAGSGFVWDRKGQDRKSVV